MKTPPFAVPPGVPDDKAYEALRKNVAERLRNVCADWSQEDFDAIVDKVARTAMKYVEKKPAPPADKGG